MKMMNCVTDTFTVINGKFCKYSEYDLRSLLMSSFTSATIEAPREQGQL